MIELEDAAAPPLAIGTRDAAENALARAHETEDAVRAVLAREPEPQPSRLLEKACVDGRPHVGHPGRHCLSTRS